VVSLEQASGYSAQCIMYWENIEAFEKAMKKDSESLIKDMLNFSYAVPATILGKLAGKN